MSDVTFGRLTDLLPREAWKHEALAFTPWLAENIDQLADAVGMTLEITGTEIAVETFAADILARDPRNDTLVLIENQLEQTDHTHLGQIMTYLAGLEAHTVIWVAPRFREPHLSAIRWLNAHTSDGFSFFAVRLRVVRIGDSPFAPIFEVIEKPNNWDRALTETRREAAGGSAIGDLRQTFWQAYLERYPAASEWGLRPFRTSSAWMPVAGLDTEAFLALWVGNEDSGIFLRGGRGAGSNELAVLLRSFEQELAQVLGTSFNASNGSLLATRAGIGLNHADRWNELIDWMETSRHSYLDAISAQLAREAEKA